MRPKVRLLQLQKTKMKFFEGLQLFFDRFIGIDDIIAAMTKNTNFLYSVNLLNQREYQSTKRYHEVLTSISILVGFLAENQSRSNKKAKIIS